MDKKLKTTLDTSKKLLDVTNIFLSNEELINWIEENNKKLTDPITAINIYHNYLIERLLITKAEREAHLLKKCKKCGNSYITKEAFFKVDGGKFWSGKCKYCKYEYEKKRKQELNSK